MQIIDPVRRYLCRSKKRRSHTTHIFSFSFRSEPAAHEPTCGHAGTSHHGDDEDEDDEDVNDEDDEDDDSNWSQLLMFLINVCAEQSDRVQRR